MAGTVLRLITRLNRGGPLRQLAGLAPRLKALGWGGPVACGLAQGGEEDAAADLERRGVPVVRVARLGRRLHPARDARALREVLALIRRVRPDVLHTHMGKAGALGRVAGRIARVPVVHTLHGHHFDAGPLAGALARRAERALARWTARWVCLTPRQARDLTHVHGVAPRERVRIIPPGLDLAELAAAARPPLPRHARPRPDEVRFVWAGRFVPVKDPFALLAAVGRARQPWTLWMLGEGPLRAGFREAVARRGLGARVRAPGPVAEVAPWLAASRGLVLCSRSEGASLAALEAMGLGRAVVTTTVGGMPDVVAHEREGLWVPPGDPGRLAEALDRLAADPALAARLGAAGRERAAARHGADALAHATAALYEEVRAGGGTMPRR